MEDPEKAIRQGPVQNGTITTPSTFSTKFRSAADRIGLSSTLEARGIQRVEEHERHPFSKSGYINIALIWFTVNLAANNIALGLLGPLAFELSFLDSALCAVFGSMIGSVPTAYSVTWGPWSGNRTLIVARYSMGWWPSKLCVLLGLVINLGYSMIDAVVAGQLLSAVADGTMSVVVGIVVVAIITWVITTLGIKPFHVYQRYASIPQIVAIFILFGTAGPKFNTLTASNGTPATVAGNRLSFFSLALAAAITYSASGADYFVYYPTTTSRPLAFLLAVTGLIFSFTLTLLLGAGLASATYTNPALSAAYNTSPGALIAAGYADLGGFGKFCAVLLALGLVSNMVAPTYSAGIEAQILGRYAARVPRIVWNTVGIIAYTACALAGRNELAHIFENFLALMGYWVAIWMAIAAEEEFIFRRPGSGRGFDWTAWNERDKLPIGLAAGVAFVVGWVGAVLCMAQIYYIGPIAGKVGDHGADMGNYVGFSLAAIFYPPLRVLELKRFRR
ncbi:MAG: hypothetical protein M1833_002178 [Piccolia ochrophora]|nr:MAG: hypothetical protein M1833_002178 [Piccolia ochrophora]